MHKVATMHITHISSAHETKRRDYKPFKNKSDAQTGLPVMIAAVAKITWGKNMVEKFLL